MTITDKQQLATLLQQTSVKHAVELIHRMRVRISCINGEVSDRLRDPKRVNQLVVDLSDLILGALVDRAPSTAGRKSHLSAKVRSATKHLRAPRGEKLGPPIP